MKEKPIRILFSDTYATRKDDAYKTLEVEIRVPLDAAVTDSDIPSMAKELARTKLKTEAAAAAGPMELEIILTNVDIRRRGDTDGMAIYNATAEAYMHATPQKPTTSRTVKNL